MDIGTQTDSDEDRNTITVKLNSLSALNRSTLSINQQGNCTPRDNTHDLDQKNLVIRISEDLLKSFPSPQVILPRLEEVCSSLGYEHIKRTNQFKSLGPNKSENENPKLNFHRPIYKTTGINTEIVLGNCNIEGCHSIFHSKKNIFTSFSNPDVVTVPIDVFKSFSSPYVLLNRLKLGKDFEKKSAPKIRKSTRKKIEIPDKKQKKKYLDYYRRIPTSALRELITERNEVVGGRKQVVQEPNPMFKINDVFHSESCSICNEVFKSKERLKIHQDIKHSHNALKKKMEAEIAALGVLNNEQLLSTTRLRSGHEIPKRSIVSNPKTNSKEPNKIHTAEIIHIKGGNQDSNEDIDVETIETPIHGPFHVPDVVLFDDLIELKYDHTYSRNKSQIETNNSNLNDDTLQCNWSCGQLSTETKTDKLFEINQIKRDILIWEQIRIGLYNDYKKGTSDLEKNYKDIMDKLKFHAFS